jgi:hypothetical protein
VEVAAALNRQFIETLKQMNCTKRVSLRVELVDEIQRTEIGGKLLQMRSLVEPPVESSDLAAA